MPNNKKPKGGYNLGLILTVLIAIIGGLWTLGIVAQKALEDYISYRIQTDDNTQQVKALMVKVSTLQHQMPTQDQKLEKEIDQMVADQAVIKTTVESNHTRLVELENAQEVIKKELKDLDQRKLNSSAYWRGQQELNRRLEYLERQIKK